MNLSHMTPPRTRAEFEKRLFLFRERLRAGQVHLPIRFVTEGLLRVRLLPNGRIDLLSIDEKTRNIVNTMVNLPPDPLQPLAEERANEGDREPESPQSQGPPQTLEI